MISDEYQFPLCSVEAIYFASLSAGEFNGFFYNYGSLERNGKLSCLMYMNTNCWGLSFMKQVLRFLSLKGMGKFGFYLYVTELSLLLNNY